jgi:hypothetical protein
MLSDVQELLLRNEKKEAERLLNTTKEELFRVAWEDANSGLSFEQWAKREGLFFSSSSDK